MKLNTTINTIERIGNVSNEAQFRMKTSQKAFQILSDLYSDKPLAIVRELGCNAADSMTAAGKADKPFHIHLPNALEPWLMIEDFGTGISHEDIYEIYTVYFASTKTNSNSQIGCLGLGSKSPFCYSDNFSVTSTHNGVRRIYNAYFNEQGTPAIALMSTENTTESNGVKIQIPIKHTDFNDFITSVQKAFRFFEVKPTISGGRIQWDVENPLFQSDDWAFYENISNKYSGESFAIMGGVTYPINIYQVKDDEGEYHQMLRNGLVLKFAMGELDFTPARDALSYTPLTIKAINDKLAKVKKELPIKVTENIDTKDTLLEAIRATLFFTEKFYFLNVNRIGNKNDDIKITWKGIDITQPLGFFRKLAPDLQVFSKYAYHRRKVSISNQPRFGSDVEWFYDDLPKGGERRVRAYLTSSNAIMLFNKKDYDNLLKNNFSEDMFKLTSSLPSPTVQRKVRNGTVVQKAKEDITIYRMGETYKDSWKSEVIEPSDTLPKCYIVKPTDGWKPKVKLQGVCNLSTKADINMVLGGFANLSSDDICMVSQREEKKLIKRGGCMKLEDWWKANVNLASINVEEVKTIAESGSYYMDDLIKSKDFKSLSDSNVIKQAVLRFADMKKRNQDYVNSITYLESYDKIKMIDLGLTPAQKIVFDFLTHNHYDMEKYFTLAEALG
jgi:hypothetical protein